ncbi:hypothetical protein RchiOBHm_Chr1g0334891 [Rosa chinensis]|uniref:Uncharacterized protein n=1 Tax=Rosa chinensis TaxID=74649 RepID=A0A2P6SCH6_ROSCH|nr:hypothetical protein RchiOBHm_Chr1g0334891 [Rosa chinensis]
MVVDRRLVGQAQLPVAARESASGRSWATYRAIARRRNSYAWSPK